MGLCDGVVGVGSIGGSGVDDLRSGQGFLATGGYGIPSRWKNSPGIIPHSTRYRQSDFAHLEASASNMPSTASLLSLYGELDADSPLAKRRQITDANRLFPHVRVEE
jgi:hypothetical protein